MQAALAVFLLLLAQASQPVVEVAAGGSTDLSCTAFPSCECHHDSATLLQSRSHQALAVDFGPTCLQANLNNGTCVGDNKCFKCDLQGAQNLLPSDETRFPESRLLCDGDSSSTCSLNTTSLPIRFLEASQVMVCKGTGTCRDEWKVENVGAVCCSSPSNVGQTCYFSSFALQNNTLCQSDMCCDGVQVCSNSTMNGVESLLCKGYLACSDSTVGLERDLYCNETSDVNLAPSLSGGTCSRSWFDFTNGESNQHVVDCLGNGVCDGSFFTFDTNASVSMECDSNGGGMGGACQNATITLAADVCLDLNCTQDVDCLNMVVNLNGGKCFFNNFGQQTRPNFVAVCTATNGTECGPIQREPICCKDEPDCGSCCAEPSTTTITTESPFEPSSSTTTSSTTSDICCDGVQVCSNSTINTVESLLCKGFLSCSDSTFGLGQDLYCSETSDVAPSLSGGTCSRSWFDFTNGESNQHVVDCLGNGVCDRSFFTFDTNASVSMECDSNGGGMGGACQNATITLAADVCLDLNCTQDVDCLNMVVNLNGGKCFFNNFGQQTRPNFVAVCTATNGTECGPIQREPIICTSTTSSTTSTTKPYPRNRRNRRNRREHRRNRRQNRRNRRQHARQYRYSM